MTTLETIYKAFQKNPNRLTYSTSKLQKQFNASKEDVLRAKFLYRVQPKDFTSAVALTMNSEYPNTDYIDCFWSNDDEMFQQPFGILKPESKQDTQDIQEDQWEVKQKWVKGKEGSQLLVRKEKEVDYKKEFTEFVNSFKPLKTPSIRYSQTKDNLAVVCMFDIHLGKVAHLSYTDNIDNLLYQELVYDESFKKLLYFLQTQSIDRILLPIGNDLFNVDDTRLATVKGTPQSNTSDLHKVFKTGLDLMVKSINALLKIAPIDVVLVPGNHASTVETYLAVALNALYKNNPNITIDDNPLGRKYYTYGSNLIGLVHGELPLKRYIDLLPFEAKEQFGKSRHIEILCGDKHKEELHKNNIADGDGIIVRRLAALTKTDLWHYQNGYTLSKRRSYVLVYNSEDGLTIQYTNAIN